MSKGVRQPDGRCGLVDENGHVRVSRGVRRGGGARAEGVAWYTA